jgi:predicted nucleic acid-binding protein
VKVLLDTCVLSELRLPKPDAGVASAIQDLDSGDLFVSAVSTGENRQRRGASRRRPEESVSCNPCGRP